MSKFIENREAIERNAQSILAVSDTLTSEVDRAVSAENGFVSHINPNPLMYTTELVAPSSLTDDYAGRVYLLLSSYDNYSKGHVYKVVPTSGGYGYADIAETDMHLANVTQLRHISEGDVAYVWWGDPDDVTLQGEVISKWSGTKLVCKAYDSPQRPEADAYPKSIDDGVVMTESTVRNQYRDTPYAAEGLDPDKVYYCRLFPYTESGDAMLANPERNSFVLSDFGWAQFEKLLEEYPKYSEYLPQVGSAVALKYMEGDYYISNGSKTSATTRAEVLSSLEDIATIDVNWLVLGYNANTPQFVKYRRAVEDGVDGLFDYVYVSTVNDGTYECSFVDLQGRLTNREVLSGDMLLKSEIAAGDRVYRKEYDEDTDTPVYYYANERVSAVSDVTEETGGFRYGDFNTFTAPTRITVGGLIYDFCGYNMTIQSQNLLTGAIMDGGANPVLKSWIQFDAAEAVSANACNTYETFATTSYDYGYYYLNNGAYVAIDVVGEELEGEAVQYYNGNGSVVYKTHFAEHPFHDAQKRPIPSLEQETETYKELHVYLNSNGTTLKKDVDYAIGDVILASDNIYETPNVGGRSNGCSLYEQSLIRQYVNSTLGSSEQWWKMQNRWDNKGTSALTNCNGVLLKMKKEANFLKSVIPAVNKVILSNNNYMYVKKWLYGEGGFYFDYVVDRMFLLSAREVGLTNASATNEESVVFSEIYRDNASRMKFALQFDGGTSQNAGQWWLRSPSYVALYGHETCVTNSGTCGNNYTCSTPTGCAPACVVG